MNSIWSSHSDREPEIPPDALIAVLNTQVAVPNSFVPAFRNSRGLRLRATDAAWSHGERGPVVEGRAAELVSVLGRPAEGAATPRRRRRRRARVAAQPPDPYGRVRISM